MESECLRVKYFRSDGQVEIAFNWGEYDGSKDAESRTSLLGITRNKNRCHGRRGVERLGAAYELLRGR
jgi:hypothetical protein